MYTGKSIKFTIEGKKIDFFNQRCKAWTHPYQWEGEGDLADSGCGIFSLCHLAQWITGNKQDPEKWADFACTYGGRGDDGTDRPVLLDTLIKHKRNHELGFYCNDTSLQNDKEKLFNHIFEDHGVAMCNLRIGHIVALVDARIINGQKQILVLDSYSESSEETICNSIVEVIENSAITWPVINDLSVHTGINTTYGAFWVDAQLPMNFNLINRLDS